MRVQHNISSINAHRNLKGNNNKVGKSLEKLSSGFRINRAADDAAGLAISEKMRAQITCLTQAETNCNDGISLIQTAEGALTEVHDMLNRMVELAEQSANGVYQDSVDRENLELEVKQLVKEIDRIASATNFNGIVLLDGNMDITLQIGESADTFNKLDVSIESMNSTGLSITTVSVAKQSDASDSIKIIKDAINTVSETRGTLGGQQNRLEHTINNLSVTNENMTAAESRIRDVDMAKEMMAYTSNNILSQAAQSMLAQANQVPQQVLSLLQ